MPLLRWFERNPLLGIISLAITADIIISALPIAAQHPWLVVAMVILGGAYYVAAKSLQKTKEDSHDVHS